MHGDINGEGWQIVTNRRRNKDANIKKPTTISYYFTDIPPGWNEAALWKTFAKYGRITDVYIAKKTSTNGKDFGFGRFIEVSNPITF